MEHGGGHADRAGALGNELLLFDHGEDRCSDFVLGDGGNIVHILLHQRERGVAGVLDGDAVGKGVHRVQGDLMSLAVAFKHAGGVAGLDAVDLHRGLELLDGIGHAGDEAAAADGHDDRIHIPHLLEDLQADGSLAGDDLVVVKGVDEGSASLLLGFHRSGVGVVIGAGHQHHLGAQALGGLHLADGGRIGHVDHALRPLAGGGQGDALGVVAGAAGDDSGLLLLVAQLADLIIGAPELEAAGHLEVLCFEIELRVAQKIGRVNEVGAARHLLEYEGCVIDLIQGDHDPGTPFRLNS